mmetsp:Transcript_16468/g.24635  ORF Transcript_16468/g.24635 Transcript_16468/m.24635 type:complete len:451 (+) Transcript_16468:173-1525(+)
MKLISVGFHLCAVLSADAFVNGPIQAAPQFKHGNGNVNAPVLHQQYTSINTQSKFETSARAPKSQLYNPYKHAQKSALSALAIDSAQEGSWKAYLDDEKTGLIFYYNHQTGESTWKPPSPSFPKVQPTGFLEERMMDVRNTYLDTLQRNSHHAVSGSGPFHFQSLANKLQLQLQLGRNVQKENEVKALRLELESQLQLQTEPRKAKARAGSLARPVTANEGVISSSLATKPGITGSSHTSIDTRTGIEATIDNMMNFSISSRNIFQDKIDEALAKVNGATKNSSTNDNDNGNKMGNDNNNNKNTEPPKRDGKFDFAQRIESTKAGVTGLVAGGAALIPFNILQAVLTDSSDKSLQFIFDTGSGAVEAALFAIVYRYCVRDGEESNDMLGQGVWGAFAITRALSAGKGFDLFDSEMIQQIAFSGIESFAMFGAAKFAMDFVAEKGFVKRME